MRNRNAISKAAAALVALIVTITIGACSGTPHVRSITLTFIRHAESTANAANIIGGQKRQQKQEARPRMPRG